MHILPIAISESSHLHLLILAENGMRIYIAFEETNRREGRDVKDVEAKKIQFDFLTS